MSESVERLARMARALSEAERADLLRRLRADPAPPSWLDAAEARYRNYRRWLLRASGPAPESGDEA